PAATRAAGPARAGRPAGCWSAGFSPQLTSSLLSCRPGSVEALDLAVRPRMGRFGQAMLHAILPTDTGSFFSTRRRKSTATIRFALGYNSAKPTLQAAHAVALKTAVQGRARELRNSFLQGIQAVIERQQRVLAKGNGNGLFFGREHRRSGLRPHWGIGCCGAFSLLGQCFRVNAVALG
nr:hypothetical protein [Tanacetum cinerariifolium]